MAQAGWTYAYPLRHEDVDGSNPGPMALERRPWDSAAVAVGLQAPWPAQATDPPIGTVQNVKNSRSGRGSSTIWCRASTGAVGCGPGHQ
jgi:hypothetical protein